MEDQLLQDQIEETETEFESPEVEETEQSEAPTFQPYEADVDRNIANLRRIRKEEKEKYERELREAREKLARYENQQPQSQMTDHEKLMKKVEELERSNIEAQIKIAHPDVDEVVSADNIQILIDEHPEIANVLRNTNDLKDKTLAAYKFIKQLGIAQPKAVNPDAERARINASKPKPLASIASGNSALSHANMFANGLTPELKSALLKEMVESARGA